MSQLPAAPERRLEDATDVWRWLRWGNLTPTEASDEGGLGQRHGFQIEGLTRRAFDWDLDDVAKAATTPIDAHDATADFVQPPETVDLVPYPPPLRRLAIFDSSA
jgi:hypothetical protein